MPPFALTLAERISLLWRRCYGLLCSPPAPFPPACRGTCVAGGDVYGMHAG